MVSKLWFLNCFILFIKEISSLEIPTIDVNSIGGKIGFIGDYGGISPFQQPTQLESYQNALIYSYNQLFHLFANINGTIETYCKLDDYTLILAGNFTSINSTTFNHIVQLNTQSRQFSALNQGLDGPVHSLYCLNSTTVYVGGDFIAPIQSNTSDYTGHVAVYSNNQWSPLPWKGFNGPVYSIQNHQQYIYFAGQFNSTGSGQYYNQNMTYPLVDLSSTAKISGGNTIHSANYSDPSSVLCSQTSWLLEDGSTGFWQALFDYPVQPTMFRLSNAHVDGKNTKSFSIVSLVSNEHFTLSYTDPTTNQIVTCSEHCHLSNDTNVHYQDFTVVNSISTSGLRINIDSWYGSAGGLGGVAIYKLDSTLLPQTTAVSNNTCSATSVSSTTSSTILTGNWTQQYSYEAYQNYIISEINASELSTSTASITYLPYIPADGAYEVYVNTPGCVGTSTCNERTQMQLEIQLTPGNTTTMELNQNIDADQRLLIYNGTITAYSSTFKPTIVMKISPTATASSEDTVTLIGSSIEFNRNNNASVLSSILQYFPANNTWTALPLPTGAIVRTLQANDNDLYIGGQFNLNNTLANIATYNSSGLHSLSDGGLNGQVLSSLLIGSNLILGGQFNSTLNPTSLSLNHITIYDIQTNTWSAMDQGVNNDVEYLYSTDQTTVHISGHFNATTYNNQELRLYNNIKWNLNTKSWTIPTDFIVGKVANEVTLSSTDTLYLGSIINAQTYRADGIASLEDPSFASNLTVFDPNAVINTATFWMNGPETSLILAGTFHHNTTVIMYSQGQWRNLIENVQGQIHALQVVKNTLFIGGNFTAQNPDGSTMTSFAVYDLEKQTSQAVAGVYDINKNPGVVNAMYPYKGSIYVAGDFAFAGSLNCNAICTITTDSRQWNPVNNNIAGNVTDIYVDNNGKVMIAGTLVINQNTHTSLATLDSNTWNTVPIESTQSVSSILYQSDNKYVIAGKNTNGSTFIGTLDGQKFSTDNMHLDPSSNINQLLWVPIDSSSARSVSRYPSNTNYMLLAIGHIVSANLGNSSAALYDGSNWYPYLLSASKDGTGYGQIQQMVTANDCCTSVSNARHYLPVAAIILISLAISLGVIFVMMLISFIYLYIKHKNTPVQYYSDPMADWKPKHRPMSFLEMLNAANLTEPSTSAAAAAAAAAQTSKDAAYTTAFAGALGTATHRGQASMDISDGPAATTEKVRNSSGLSMAAIPFAALFANALKSNKNGVATEDAPKIYYAKYPFEAKEFGELAFDAQTPIVVTDTSDNVWWMGYKDDGKGNAISGLFPSNYVSRSKPT